MVGPTPLDETHDVESFGCSSVALERYLHREALVDQGSAKIRTYVVSEGARVVAYLCILAGVVEAAPSRERIAQRRRRQAVPVVVLSRIAVDREWQRMGIGRALVEWAVRRSAGAAQVIGARALVTTATDHRTRSFFENNGFEPLPGDVYRFFAPLGGGALGTGRTPV